MLQGGLLCTAHIYKFLPPESLQSVWSGLASFAVTAVEFTPWLCHRDARGVLLYNPEDQDVFFNRDTGSRSSKSIL